MTIKNELATVFGSRPTWIDSAEEHGDILRIDTNNHPQTIAAINAKLEYLRNSDYEITIINSGRAFEFRKLYKSDLYTHDFETQIRVDSSTKRSGNGDVCTRLAERHAESGYPVTLDDAAGYEGFANNLTRRGWLVSLSRAQDGEVSALKIERPPLKPRLVPKAAILEFTTAPQPNAAVAHYRKQRELLEKRNAAARRAELERKINQKRAELAELEKQLEASA